MPNVISKFLAHSYQPFFLLILKKKNYNYYKELYAIKKKFKWENIKKGLSKAINYTKTIECPLRVFTTKKHMKLMFL